jgi:hypothetical protein
LNSSKALFGACVLIKQYPIWNPPFGVYSLFHIEISQMAGPLFGLLVLDEVAMRWHLKFTPMMQELLNIEQIFSKKFSRKNI